MPPLFSPVLLPLDGSALSEGILPLAIQFAEKSAQPKLTLVYVAGNASEKVNRSTGGATLTAHDYLNLVAKEAGRNSGVQVDTVVLEGKPAEEIVKYGQEKGFGLIAMATHGRSGVGRWVYGSTTDRVLQATNLPLFIVRPNEKALREAEQIFKSIIVALDGSELGESVLPGVEGLAKRRGLEVIVLRVVPTATMAVAGAEPYIYDPNLYSRIVDAANEYVAQKVTELIVRGVRATPKVLQGYPPQEIIDLAEKTPGSLVVMSTHGRSGVSRWVLGSVADRVLRASARPVLLLR